MNASPLLLLLATLALATQAPPPRDAPRRDHFPPVTTRDTGPDTVRIDSIALHYSPVAFDHRLHVSMTELAGDCPTCHHETEPDQPITACSECHASSSDNASFSRPSLKGAFHRQCLGCHREWSQENACASCHEEATGDPQRWIPPDLTDTVDAPHADVLANPCYTYTTGNERLPVVTFHHTDHTLVFGLQCSDCHRGSSCNACHGPEAAPRAVNRYDSCYTCHASQNCVLCHSPGERPAFNHATSVGWGLGSSHRGLPCTDCHGQERNFAAPASATCLACHQAPDATRSGHADSDVPLLGSHAYFDCTNCHRGDDAATISQCDRCHADRSYPDFTPGQPALDTGTDAEPRSPVVTDEALAGH